MAESSLTGIEQLNQIIEQLNTVGGTPKLDLLRQEYKYHDLLDVLRNFVQEFDLYADYLDKFLKKARLEVLPVEIRHYLAENQYCNYDDFWLDYTIISVYQKLCDWIGGNGEYRLDEYLFGSYGKIRAALIMLGLDTPKKKKIKSISEVDELLTNPQVRDEAKMDEVADKLLQPISKSTFEQPKFYTMKEAAETWNEIPEQKRKWYFDRCQKLLPFIASVGRDFGDYQCSEEIVNYWKLRNSAMNIGEIWLKCAIDYWQREENGYKKESA